MKILAVDPGTRYTGWAISCEEGYWEMDDPIFKWGHITLKDGMTGPEKMGLIYNTLNELIQSEPIGLIAIEDQITNRFRPRAGLVVSRVRGIVELLSYNNGLPLEVYNIKTIKKNFTGNGNASKSEMVQQAKNRYKVERLTEDEADAIAIAELAMAKLVGGSQNGNIQE